MDNWVIWALPTQRVSKVHVHKSKTRSTKKNICTCMRSYLPSFTASKKENLPDLTCAGVQFIYVVEIIK